MKKYKFLNLIRNLCLLAAPIVLMYLMKNGEVKVEKSSETSIWIILFLLSTYGIFRTIREFKRDDMIEVVNSMSEEDYIKIRELKKKNGDYLKRRVYIILIISLLSIPLVILFLLKIHMYWLILFVPLVFAGILLWNVIRYSQKTAVWYYDLDEFLYYRYQLVECLNKKQKLSELLDEIKEQKRLLKQRKELKQMEKKLLQPEEIEIRKITSEIEELKKYNEYTKRLPDGSELRFSYTILKYGRRKNISYNVKSTVYVNREKIKPEEQIKEIIDKHEHLNVFVDDTGVIETQFKYNHTKINYELLINWVSYSYEVGCQCLKN